MNSIFRSHGSLWQKTRILENFRRKLTSRSFILKILILKIVFHKIHRKFSFKQTHKTAHCHSQTLTRKKIQKVNQIFFKYHSRSDNLFEKVDFFTSTINNFENLSNKSNLHKRIRLSSFSRFRFYRVDFREKLK